MGKLAEFAEFLTISSISIVGLALGGSAVTSISVIGTIIGNTGKLTKCCKNVGEIYKELIN